MTGVSFPACCMSTRARVVNRKMIVNLAYIPREKVKWVAGVNSTLISLEVVGEWKLMTVSYIESRICCKS